MKDTIYANDMTDVYDEYNSDKFIWIQILKKTN